MADRLDEILARAISPSQVRPDGPLTNPRSYGVYALPDRSKATRRYRFGNHPVRQRELEAEFGSAQLLHLFRARQQAEAVAKSLNGLQALPIVQADAALAARAYGTLNNSTLGVRRIKK